MARRPSSILGLVDQYETFALGWYRKPKTRRPTGEHVQIHHALKHLLNIPLPSDLCPPELSGVPGALLEQMDPEHMRAEHLDLARQAMIKSGLSLKVVNARVSRVRRMFRWAAKAPQRYITALIPADLDLLDRLKAGRTEARYTQDVQPIEWEHVTSTMAVVSVQVATMIELAWHTGMRPGELVNMRQSLIDQSQPIWLYRPEEHKNEHHNHERTVYLGPI